MKHVEKIALATKEKIVGSSASKRATMATSINNIGDSKYSSNTADRNTLITQREGFIASANGMNPNSYAYLDRADFEADFAEAQAALIDGAAGVEIDSVNKIFTKINLEEANMVAELGVIKSASDTKKSDIEGRIGSISDFVITPADTSLV